MKIVNFLSSKKGGLLMILLIAAAIPLTVIVSQQQQEIRQHASRIIPSPAPGSRPPCYIPQKIIDKIRPSTNNQNLNSKWRQFFGYGDVDLDGSVTTTDNELILKFDVGSYKLTPLQIEAADVDGVPNYISGKSDVGVTDALKILRYTRGLEKTFPVCGNPSAITPTCRPRPRCLDATPRCLIAETPDMCPRTK